MEVYILTPFCWRCKRFLKADQDNRNTIVVAFNNISRVNNSTIAGLIVLRLKYYLAKPWISGEGERFYVLSQSQSPTQFYLIKSWIGWVGFADTQISILPGISRKCNVRSKIWWFTKICNSHYVSHFAAFFIVVGAKTSVAESCT